MIARTFTSTPVGIVEIQTTEKGISRLQFVEEVGDTLDPTHPFLVECSRQINNYFMDKAFDFSIPLDLKGTDFQKQVWKELLDIPYGKTTTYLKIAKKINQPEASRAVGNACGKNKLWLVVPCHRVVATNGHLTGYAGGLDTKKWLLQHERKQFLGTQTSLF